ncbi:unnamed protein product [Prorocentrum cordatum]|uniref:Biogenesis of lysosome-related organelles complex 1 subunit 1 n=1 Tax=Prorocentrum cordatum TaxID=2364126 RepID=A0ABN9TVB8_9DINO|nr:unnamed protein product [Polarella glacialis]
MAGTGQKDKEKRNPMNSPDNHKGRKLDNDDFQIARVKGMPEWAEAMQKALMQHTADQIGTLTKEVDEAKVMAMKAQEEIREVHKEVGEMRVKMKNLEELQEEFRRSSEGMWNYMTKNAGKHIHQFQGKTIYCNVDSRSRDPESEEARRETAVRKGIVWWKDKRVAVWKDGKMELLGTAAQWHGIFRGLFPQ